MTTHAVNPWKVVVKGLVLYGCFQAFLLFSGFNPAIFNVYLSAALQRVRFPAITSPKAEDRALDVGILDTMFASHVISRPKRENEYRVILVGDSSIWGEPLPADDTLSSQLNKLKLTCGAKQVSAYNLGYPYPSAIKDMMIVDKAMQFHPDLVIWAVTTYTLTTRLVEEHPLLGTEPALLDSLNSKYHFLKEKPLPQTLPQRWTEANFRLSRSLRYQSYSLIQLATATDQVQAESSFPNLDLKNDLQYMEMSPPILARGEIFTELVNDFIQTAKDTPVILINEPMLVVQNEPNSNLRYNSYYPRWAYDQYRQYMQAAAGQFHWTYLDFWNQFPPDHFANSPLHLNRRGVTAFAKLIAPAVQASCPKQ